MEENRKVEFFGEKKKVEPVSNCIEHLMTDYLIEIDEMKTKKNYEEIFIGDFSR